MLYAEFPNPVSPKEISAVTRANHENVKKWLQRDQLKSGAGYTVRHSRGYYRAKATMKLLKKIGLEPFKIHGIQMMIMSPNGGRPPRLEGLGDTKTNKDGSTEQVTERLGRRVTIAESGLISIRASTMPFEVGEFLEVASWVEGLAAGFRVEMRSIELNIDVEDHLLKLDGVKAMTLSGFRDGLLKIYDKQVLRATRFEACIFRLDMTAKEAAAMLNEMSQAVPKSSLHESAMVGQSEADDPSAAFASGGWSNPHGALLDDGATYA